MKCRYIDGKYMHFMTTNIELGQKDGLNGVDRWRDPA
jgi:hypothetical protein